MQQDAGSASGPANIVNLRVLLRHWPMCVGVTLLTLSLAAVYLSVVEPVYEAEVRVVIQNLGLGLDGTAGRKTYDREFLSTQAELIRSPLVVGRALESVPSPVPPEPDADPIAGVLKHLRVSPLANTDIIRVTWQNSDPVHATRRLRSILESYQSHLRESERSSASEAFSLLKQRESELSDRLKRLQEQVTQIRGDANASLTGTETGGDDRALLKELTSRWAAVRAERAWVDASSTQSPKAVSSSLRLSSRGNDSLLSREASDLQAALTSAQAELQEISLVYGPDHPERTAREGRVAALKTHLQERQVQLAGEFTDYQQKLAAEDRALQTLVEQELSRLQEHDALLLTEERHLAEIERVRELHRSTLTTLEAVGLADRAVADGRVSINVQAIDDFVVPQEPIWPQPVPLLGASAMLGLLLSVACIVLLESQRSSTAPLSPATLPAAAASAGYRSTAQATGQPEETDGFHVRMEDDEEACIRELNELQDAVRQRTTTARDASANSFDDGVTA